MRRRETRDPTLLQVLSLYLLLLAFFVILFNASRFDQGKANALGESLTTAFRTAGKPTRSPLPHTSQVGHIPGDQLLLGRMGDLVKTEIAVAEIRTMRAGRLMRVRIPANELFEPGTTGIRTDREHFVRELALLLGTRPPGRRHKVEARIGSGWITPDQLKDSVPLPVGQAASLAEVLIANGALSGTISAGIEPEAEGRVTLVYRVDPEYRPEEAEPPGMPGDAE